MDVGLGSRFLHIKYIPREYGSWQT